MIRLTVILTALMTLTACLPMGPARPGQQPNSIQRATVLSANDKSITIEHSDWGKPIAFEKADAHCSGLGLDAVYQGASQQFGADVISSWKCE